MAFGDTTSEISRRIDHRSHMLPHRANNSEEASLNAEEEAGDIGQKEG